MITHNANQLRQVLKGAEFFSKTHIYLQSPKFVSNPVQFFLSLSTKSTLKFFEFEIQLILIIDNLSSFILIQIIFFLRFKIWIFNFLRSICNLIFSCSLFIIFSFIVTLNTLHWRIICRNSLKLNLSAIEK